jgi:hypothetical protein
LWCWCLQCWILQCVDQVKNSSAKRWLVFTIRRVFVFRFSSPLRPMRRTSYSGCVARAPIVCGRRMLLSVRIHKNRIDTELELVTVELGQDGSIALALLPIFNAGTLEHCQEFLGVWRFSLAHVVSRLYNLEIIVVHITVVIAEY